MTEREYFIRATWTAGGFDDLVIVELQNAGDAVMNALIRAHAKNPAVFGRIVTAAEPRFPDPGIVEAGWVFSRRFPWVRWDKGGQASKRDPAP